MERKDNPPFLTRKDLAFQEGKQFGIEINIVTDRPYIVILRGITKEGPFEYNTVNTATSVNETFFYNIPDIPIMLTVQIKQDGIPVYYGKISAYLTINRSRYGVLIQGNLNGFDTLSWPNQLPLTELQTRGFIRSNTIANPAPGAELSTILSDNGWMRIKAIQFNLTTDATVAVRRVSFVVDPIQLGGLVMPANVSQIAGTTKTYIFGEGLATIDDAISNIISAPIFNDILLPALSGIKIQVQNIQATDQLSNIKLFNELSITPTP